MNGLNVTLIDQSHVVDIQYAVPSIFNKEIISF